MGDRTTPASRRRTADLRTVTQPRPAAPIGVFDSGIGGLTVVAELRRRLPHEHIVYLGDTARVPYGSKSVETVRRFAWEDARFLLGRGVKLIVVACHSASSVALDELKGNIGVPVIGVVEPGARALCRATRAGRVGVIGTVATVRSASYERALRALRPDVEVVARPTPLLVPLAEEGIDALLLGCTHFPLLRRAIARAAGRGVRIVDSSAETAAAVAAVLTRTGIGVRESGVGVRKTRAGGALKVYLTDLTPSFETVGARFLGAALGEVTRVSLGEEGRGQVGSRKREAGSKGRAEKNREGR